MGEKLKPWEWALLQVGGSALAGGAALILYRALSQKEIQEVTKFRRFLIAVTAVAIVTIAGAVLMALTPTAQAQQSATTERIAFASNRDGNYEIYVMNADGSGVTQLTQNSGVNENPAWSPAGGRIAFTSTRDGNLEIYVMNADGSGQTRLTSNSAWDGDPTWSPDGLRIAFESYRDGNTEIYVMNVDGSNVTRLTNNSADDGAPAWSPEGESIAFISYRDGNTEIYVMNVDGSNVTRLTNIGGYLDHPVWAPDGQRIAFASNRDGNYEIYVMNADGSNVTRLTSGSQPTWAPDGQRIAFISSRDGKYEIYAMNADGSNVTRLTNDSATDKNPAYSVGATVVIEDDHADDIDGATAIKVGEYIQGAIDYEGDSDFFSFQAERDKDYEIAYDLDMTLETPEDWRGGLYDSDGEGPLWDTYSRYNDSYRIEWRATSSGEYYLEAGGYIGTGSYTLSVVALDADDHEDATAIDVGEDIQGVMNYGYDEDTFVFRAEEGTLYEIDVTLGTLVKSEVELFDADGEWLKSIYYGGDDTSYRYWEAPASSEYYVEVRSGFGTGSYTLTVAVSDVADDHGNSFGGATAINVGEGVQGVVNYEGDEDAFVFRAEEGTLYEIDMTLGTLEHWQVGLYDTDGEQLGYSFSRWEAPASGEYYLKVYASYGDTGSYTLTISDVDDDHGDSFEDATPINLGETIQGVVDFIDDVDLFSFQAEGGKRYQIDVALETLEDSWVELYDSNESYLADNDDYGDSYASRLVWEATESGEYYVVVGGFLGTGSYTLTVAALDVNDTPVPSGRIAFASERDGNREIYVMNADGSGQTRLTSNSAEDGSPVWSPDGRRIAFYSYRDDNGDIYMMNADGSGETRLTSNSAFDGDPAWSPDGQYIAFASTRDGDYWNIYVMDANGSRQTRLTSNAAHDFSPTWSPDGQRIAFTSYPDGNYEIYVMNADGSGQTRLSGNSDSHPAWSPDGERIAFVSQRDGNWEIYVMNADGSRQTRLTSNSATDASPAWSPDGQYIAFTSDRDGSWDMYVMNADGSSQTRLTSNSAEDPAWSVAPTDRGILEILYNSTGGEDWKNNANWVSDRPLGEWHGVATDGQGRVTGLSLGFNGLAGEIPAGLGDLANLEELDLGGNELYGAIPAELGGLANLERLRLFTTWLHGGIPAELGGLAGLEELDLGGNLLHGEIPAELGGLAKLERLNLSGNGLTGEIPAELGGLAKLTYLGLGYNSLSGGIPPELGSLANLAHLGLGYNRLSGALPLSLANLTALASFSFGNNAGLCASMDEVFQAWLQGIGNGGGLGPNCAALSGRIAFMSSRDGNREIYVMNADGTGQTRLTSNSARDYRPVWSPNGLRIAFQSDRDGNLEIYVMNADGTGQTRLTNNGTNDKGPAWSPDGQRIAFHSDRDGNREIYVMNADGSGQTRLTSNSAENYSPAWSPDGGRIAFYSDRDGNLEIYVMNADGSGQTRLTSNSAGDGSPAWSPDGQRIAFQSDRDGNWEIYVMNADGSGQTRLTSSPGGDSVPAWSPDGRHIAFASNRDGNWEIYVMNADGTGQTRLISNSARDWYPAWSPGATTFVIYHDPSAGEAVVERYNEAVALLTEAEIAFTTVEGDVQAEVDRLAGVTGSVLPWFFLGDPTESGWESEPQVNNGGLPWLRQKVAELTAMLTPPTPVPIPYLKELLVGDDLHPSVARNIPQAFQLMHRYALSLGLLESEITRDLRVYVYGRNVDDFIAPYRQAYGGSEAEARDRMDRTNGWASGGRYIWIPAAHRGAQTAARQMKTPAHELVHVFSSNLSELSKGGPDHLTPPAGPEWINEGGADYLAYRAISWGGVFPYAIAREQARQRALSVKPEGGLAELGSEDGLDKYSGSYRYSMMAVELLVSERGDASYIEFYRSLKEGTTWQVQFEKAFGISVEDFYVKFAEHEAAGFPPLEGVAPACPAESPDRDALVAFYNATGGRNWSNNANWLSAGPVCQWHGVFTDTDGRVIVLSLERNGLSGAIPPELGRLAELTHMNVQDNWLSGTVPRELGNLSNLRKLEARRNQLGGPIPRELGSLSNLAWLSLSDNRLSGAIPPELGSLHYLAHLDLRRNRLSGEIPAELEGLSNLVKLELAGNSFTGCIPPALRDVPNNDLDRLGLRFCSTSLPTAPTIGAVTPGLASLAVSWSAPSSDGGSAVTAYDLRSIETTADETVDSNWTVADDVWTTGGGTLRYTLTGLTGGTQYDLQVRAVNAVGDGPWSATATGTPKQVDEVFDRIIPELITDWNVPGAALAIAKDGRLVLAKGYGLANVESQEPAAPDTLFRIASISKPITAIAVLQLVEEGLLTLDDRVFQILHEFRPPEGADMDPRLDDITVRHLLQHSGGWNPDQSYDPMFNTAMVEAELGIPKPISCSDVIRFMLGQPLDSDPGTEYAYSNFGYCLLGRVIEEKSGKPYEEYVKERVLAPMGISRMHIGGTLPRDRADREATYYGFPGQRLAPSVVPNTPQFVPWPDGGFHLRALDAHGGWVASAIDLVRFATSVDGSNPPQIIGPHSLQLMVARPAAPLWQGSSYYYGMGWLVRPEGDDANWWHDGSLPGTYALLVRTHHGLAWAVIFNSRPEEWSRFAQQVDRLIWEGISEVTAWPTYDLFSQYGQHR